MPFRHTQNRPPERGAALFIAIGLLAVFTILGFYYINYMSLEWDETQYEIGRTRARLAAEAGVRLALADLHYAQQQDQTVQVLNRSLEYTLPVYLKQQGAGETGFATSETYASEATVQVADENARVNINHAPASVLQRLLGIGGEEARAIVQSMPRQAEAEPAAEAAEAPAPQQSNAEAPAENEAPAWFLSVDELVDRGFVTPEQYADLDTALLTAYTVTAHDQAEGYLNLNRAPVPVLAAALDIAEEKAEELAAARPFKSLDALASAAGKTPDTFNYRPAPETPEAMPAAFALESDVFRVRSTGSYVRRAAAGAEEEVVTARVEAIVQAQPDGSWRTLHWALNPDQENP